MPRWRVWTLPAQNIMTVEDPIEYDLDGISQTQVNPRIDMTFARALRTILRQDPDVVMIGEIRDLETAQIAVQASLTGHLVFATLHTNDAVSAVNRLVDMGVEPFLLASSLIGVLAQRLVRRLCPQCRKPFVSNGATLYAAQGCAACNHSGYHGRTGIYEMLLVDDELRRLVHDRASEQQLRDHALAHGMRSLRDDGLRWVRQGVDQPGRDRARDAGLGAARLEAFQYEALDAAGRTVSGVLQADNPRQARAQLRAQGLLPSAVRALRTRGPGAPALGARHLGSRAEPADPAARNAARIRADRRTGAVRAHRRSLRDQDPRRARRGEGRDQRRACRLPGPWAPTDAAFPSSTAR